ncbi:hypothetical protein GCM10019016_046030 [Streptomyces prasinosporus]|uniref:Uncharacterized protein n=1 Tax=Streptomyces prasinosporus TaxID=68256 RepID=A0ABP6TQD1_9ACTN
MHHTHPTGAETRLETVVTGVFRKFRFRARPGVSLWRHGPTPVLFVRARDARSLVDDAYGPEAACWCPRAEYVQVCVM